MACVEMLGDTTAASRNYGQSQSFLLFDWPSVAEPFEP